MLRFCLLPCLSARCGKNEVVARIDSNLQGISLLSQAAVKTKLLFIFVFFAFFFGPANAQEYHPLLNNTSWVVSDWVSCCRQPYVRQIAPSVTEEMGTFTYHKFRNPFPFSGVDTVYVREDVMERKVYRHHPQHGDVLIYDFSLEDGDQITLDMHNIYGEITFNAAVDEIACNVGNRKRIVLSSVEQYNGHTFQQTWIEGVGSPAHPLYPAANMYNVLSSGGGTVYTTRCAFQDQEHIYGNPDNCVQYLSASGIEEQHPVTVYPNPFRQQFTVSSDMYLENATLKIFNLQGQLVREAKVSGQEILIDRNEIASGMYFVQISNQGHAVFVGKVIAE